MRRIMFLVLVTGILVSANGQNDNQTGMLFGENFVFYMTAPSGWVLDNQSGVNQGQHMVFYPQGGSWENSPVVAYGNSTPLTDTVRSVEDFVKQTVKEFRQGGSFLIKSRKQKTIPLAEGKKADIYYYTGDQWANYEAVGYILEKKTINFLVYTARDKSAFEANLDKFFEMLRSYKSAFREDTGDYGEETFNALKAKAEEDKSTVQGKEYEYLLTETQTKKIVKRFRQCLTYSDPKENIPKIGFVFIIGEDGTIEDSYAWPVTPLSLCVKGLIVGSEMPAHKLGKFYWHVFLDITVEDRIKNISYKGSSQVYAKWLNVGIIAGVMMGTVTAYKATRELIDRIDNELHGFRTTSATELREKMAGLTLKNINSNQFIASIDALYEDPCNRKIKIIDAVYIAKMQVMGLDPELIDAQIRCLRMQPVHYKTLADALNKFALISNENEKKKIGRKVTNEDIKSGKISLEEVLISRHFVDRNDENHSLFCYGDYYGQRN